MRPAELAEARRTLLVRQLYLVFALLRDRLFRDLARRGHPGLSMQHSHLLRNLPYDGAPLAQVVRDSGVSRQAMTRVARDLEARGYLEIRDNPSDARGVFVRFTRNGLILAHDVIVCARQLEDRIVRVLGSSRTSGLADDLRQILAGWDSTDDAGASAASAKGRIRPHSSRGRDGRNAR